MKIRIVLFIVLLSPVIVAAQKSKVVSAYNYLRYYSQDKSSKDLISARENIDEAAKHEQSKGLAKTWYYRGKIYIEIARSKDPEITKLSVDPVSIAFESLIKAKSFGDKKIDNNDIDQNLRIVTIMSFQNGVTAYNAKDYEKSLMNFERCIAIAEAFKVTDSLAIYNAALSADNLESYDKAVTYYEQCTELGYGGAKVYSNIADIYKKQGNDAKCMELVKKGLEKYPKDQALITEQINYFLKNDNSEEALQKLDIAIENDPRNPTFYYARGSINSKLEKLDDAIMDYKKALEIKPDYFDALYNLGAIYFNTGADLVNQSNNLPLSEKKKADELMSKAMEQFALSQPVLEKAHEIEREDKATMQSLKSIYARTKQTEKYNQIKAELEN